MMGELLSFKSLIWLRPFVTGASLIFVLEIAFCGCGTGDGRLSKGDQIAHDIEKRVEREVEKEREELRWMERLQKERMNELRRQGRQMDETDKNNQKLLEERRGKLGSDP